MKTQKIENMTAKSIRLTPTQWNECDKRAEELGLRSRNDFIRDAIDFYMEWLDKPSSQKFLTPALESVIGAKVRDKETYAGVKLTENSRMTLGEWLDKWLNEYKTPVLRSSTVHSYRNHIENHIKPHLGDKVITQVTTADVQKKFQPNNYLAACNDKYAPRIQANCKFKMAVSVPGEGRFAERPHVVPEAVVNNS